MAKADRNPKRPGPAQPKAASQPPSRLPAKAPAPLRRWQYLLILLPVAVTIGVYRDSFHGPFIFDDQYTIERNIWLRQPGDFLSAAFAQPHSPLSGRPVTALTFSLNFYFGRLELPGYHAVNLTIHLLAGMLLWGVTRRTLCAPNVDERLAPAAPWLATIVTSLWMLHPLQTEPVEYITQRTTLLMGLFMLATFYAVARSWTSPHGGWWQVVAVLCCALGMASKEDMIAAPILVVLYDGIFFARNWRDAFRQRKGLYLGLLGAWAWLGLLVTLAPHNETVGFEIKKISSLDYLQTQARAIGRYLWLSFYPRPLIVAYDWKKTTNVVDVLPQGLLILTLLGITTWGIVARRWWGWLGAWFFLILAPTSSFMPIATEYVAERRMYLPLLAVLVTMVIAGWFVVQTLADKLPATSKACRAIGVTVALVIAGSLAYGTWLRLGDYKDTLTLWLDTAAKAPDKTIVQNNLATAYSQSGQVHKAIEHHLRAAELEPGYEAYSNLSLLYGQIGQREKALEFSRRAVQIEPDLVEPRVNLVFALFGVNRFNEALQEADRAVAMRPNDGLAHNARAAALANLGRHPEAIAAVSKAIALDPSYPGSHYNLGKITLDQFLKTSPRVSESQKKIIIEHYRAGLAIDPNPSDGHYKLALTLAQMDDLRGALREFEIVAQLRPNDAGVRENIAEVRQELGMP